YSCEKQTGSARHRKIGCRGNARTQASEKACHHWTAQQSRPTHFHQARPREALSRQFVFLSDSFHKFQNSTVKKALGHPLYKTRPFVIDRRRPAFTSIKQFANLHAK